MVTEEKMQTPKPAPEQDPKKGSAPGPKLAPSPTEPEKKSAILVWLIMGFLACGVAYLAYRGWKGHENLVAAQMAHFGHQQVVPVLAETVQERDVPIYLDGLGTVQAYNTVTVHARVDGELKKVAFTEGQDVKAGDLLAIVDPDPYQAALDQAKAKKAEDQAQLVNAQINLKREIDLIAAKIDPQQTYDAQKALADQLDATVKADQAAIESAQVNLNYCRITSPLDGRVGIRLMDQGNNVHATDTNGLVVITQLQPISVIFTLPEQDLDKIHRETPADGHVKVVAVDRDNNGVIDEGTLAVIDNEIDTTTGTIRLKANFPNKKNLLWPGEFINPRLLLTVYKNGLVIPAAAVQRGPNGPYVFVIDEGAPKSAKAGGKGKHAHGDAATGSDNTQAAAKDNAEGAVGQSAHAGQGSHGHGADANGPTLYVKMQPVTVSPDVTGSEALITEGLQKGLRIVVDGQYKLQEGSPVRIVPPAKAGSVDSRSNDSNQ